MRFKYLMYNYTFPLIKYIHKYYYILHYKLIVNVIITYTLLISSKH